MDFKTFDPEQLDLSNLDRSDSNKRKEIKELLLNLIKEGENVIRKTERNLPPVIKEIDMFKAPQQKIISKNFKQIEQVRKSSTVVRAECKETQPTLQLRGLKIEKVEEPKQVPTKQLIRPVRIETISKPPPESIPSLVSCKIIKTYSRKDPLHNLQQSSVIINKAKNTNENGLKCMICKKFFKDLKLLGEHSKQDCDHRNVIFKKVDTTQSIEAFMDFEHIVIKSEFVEDPEPPKPARKILKKIPFKENVKKLEDGRYQCLKCDFISKNNHFALRHLFRHINGQTLKPVIPVPAPIPVPIIPVKRKLPVRIQNPIPETEVSILNVLNTKFYQCDQCPKAFISFINLFEHKQRMHATKEEVLSDLEDSNESEFHGFPEMLCDPVFDSVIDAVPKNMSIKLDEWLDTDVNTFLPTIVKKRANRAKANPKTKLSKGIKRFKCIICNEGFVKQFELDNHILKDHESVPTFKCEICEKILLSQSSLETHKSLLHNQTRKFSCDECENVYFPKQDLLDDHKLFKHGFKCEQCEIRPFKLKRLLDYHVFKHHAGENCNKCEQCGKIFKDFFSVKRHIQSVHENLRSKICNICGKNFKDIDMNKHMRTHTGERPFPCDLCDSTFRFNQDLVVHRRLHTGERPYECTICLMRFIANTNLNKHLKARHPVDPDSLEKLLN